jgi:hypothetical protein
MDQKRSWANGAASLGSKPTLSVIKEEDDDNVFAELYYDDHCTSCCACHDDVSNDYNPYALVYKK